MHREGLGAGISVGDSDLGANFEVYGLRWMCLVRDQGSWYVELKVNIPEEDKTLNESCELVPSVIISGP